MKKIELQKIKTFAKTHTPALLVGAAIGGAATLTIAKAHYIPKDKNTLYLTDASRKELADGNSIGFDLKDALLILYPITKD